MVFLQNVWWLLVLIGVMIMIHELGHYWVARLFDVKVETFSFGFGPRLFGFRRGETDFRFSAILFGGIPGRYPTDRPYNRSDAFSGAHNCRSPAWGAGIPIYRKSRQV